MAEGLEDDPIEDCPGSLGFGGTPSSLREPAPRAAPFVRVRSDLLFGFALT